MSRRQPNCAKCGTLKVPLRSGILRCPPCRRRRAREYYHESAKCRDRMREQYLLRTYGVSLKDLTEMLVRQNSRCAICKQHWKICPAAKRARYERIFLQHLYVDHDHATGRVRGLLCNNCNTGIALFAEDEERLQAAISYIRFHRS